MTLKEKIRLIHHLLRYRNLIVNQERSIQYIFENYPFFDFLLENFAQKKKKWPDFLKAVHYCVCDEIFYYSANVDALTINTALQIIRKSQWPFYTGFYQALFSHLSRNKDELIRNYVNQADFVQLSAHPEWMIHRWMRQYGLEATRKIIEFNNQKPALYLVVNQSKLSFQDYQDRLIERSIRYRIDFPDLPVIRLEDSIPITDLPGYDAGWFWIQDPSAVLVLYMIGFLKLHHILDMCAAPGSKSFLLSNLFPHAEIIASDHKVKKIARLKANISRLGFNHIRVIQSDGLSLPVRKIFDLILVDAPCSGLGVIQRKGDIRWSKSESVIVELAGLQSRLLDEAANRVKSGGYLLYSTCTLEPEETDQQAADFLQRHPEFTASQPVTPIKTLENMIKGFYYYSLPHLHAQSGTFAALFQKT